MPQPNSGPSCWGTGAHLFDNFNNGDVSRRLPEHQQRNRSTRGPNSLRTRRRIAENGKAEDRALTAAIRESGVATEEYFREVTKLTKERALN